MTKTILGKPHDVKILYVSKFTGFVIESDCTDLENGHCRFDFFIKNNYTVDLFVNGYRFRSSSRI